MIKIGITQRVHFIKEYGEYRDQLDQKWSDLFSEIGMAQILLPNNSKIIDGETIDSFNLNGVILSGGEFLDEKDLIKCLKNKIIDGAGLDVLHNEHTKKFRDNPKKNKLFQFYLKNKNLNLFITPKQGGSNKSAWEISEKIIINQLLKYEKNKI